MASPNHSFLAGPLGLSLWFIGATAFSGLRLVCFQRANQDPAPPVPLNEPSLVTATAVQGADRYDCSFQDLDAEGILKRLQDDLSIWTLYSNRVEVVASGFSLVSQELGSQQAVERAMRLIAESALPRSAQETLLSAVALAAFDIRAHPAFCSRPGPDFTPPPLSSDHQVHPSFPDSPPSVTACNYFRNAPKSQLPHYKTAAA